MHGQKKIAIGSFSLIMKATVNAVDAVFVLVRHARLRVTRREEQKCCLQPEVFISGVHDPDRAK